jgi:hypothetical protein
MAYAIYTASRICCAFFAHLPAVHSYSPVQHTRSLDTNVFMLPFDRSPTPRPLTQCRCRQPTHSTNPLPQRCLVPCCRTASLSLTPSRRLQIPSLLEALAKLIEDILIDAWWSRKLGHPPHSSATWLRGRGHIIPSFPWEISPKMSHGFHPSGFLSVRNGHLSQECLYLLSSQ